MTSVNSNNKSSHVASNFTAICMMILKEFVWNPKNSFMVIVA